MKITLRRFNNFLSVLVLVLSAYIFLMPVLPAVTWWAKHEAPIVSSSPTAKAPRPDAPNTPADHTLVIPSLGMTETINEGRTEATLSKGVWKLPKSSTPDKGSNTVMAGHRYTYSGSGVFYHLDKAKSGDQIYVYWGGKRYDYNVTRIIEVPPTDVSVEAPSLESILTIYTCTPLWSFKDRLVIQAKLMETI